ncbi:MAG: exosome complex RNA-binding protein Csl4 [Candidatus Nezhaarchaeota archaeon]|nr:exosome complex RNA-binding protein Csl4 [Candidatus Nezhaarchaeota archaeon]
MKEKILRDVVTPGESLGIIEEFLPGEGTYLDDDNIKSLYFGVAVLDIEERKVHVRPLGRERLLPVKGDIVIGEVNSVKRDTATIVIKKIENKDAWLKPSFHGMLHISQVSDKFVESLSSAIRVTDIVRAKIINNKVPYQLSMKDKELGVILAFCVNCQNPMVLKDRKLYCPQCRNQEEERKISLRYSTPFKLQ